MDFEQSLAEQNLDLRPVSIETLQVNLGKLCNQACKHCHVDAGPKRVWRFSGSARRSGTWTSRAVPRNCMASSGGL